MKQTKELTRTVFIGDSLQQMTDLLIHLHDKHFPVSLKKAGDTPYEAYKIQAKPWYKITTSDNEHYDVLNHGIAYCMENNLNDIICAYPNLDFDTIKNIKERELGLSK